MNNPDQDTLIRAVEDARRILGEYIEPARRDPTRTVERLLAVLDRNDVVHALDRIKRRRVIRLVEGKKTRRREPAPVSVSLIRGHRPAASPLLPYAAFRGGFTTP